MEWIKAKYDRLLLGIFGVLALLLGAFLLWKVIGFNDRFKKRDDAPVRSEFGKNSEERLDAVKTRLTEPVVVKAPSLRGKPIGLFTSSPVVKMAGPNGEAIAILDPQSKQLRPPIPNIWLYDNDLDITRADIATLDNDGDGFTNAEEFTAGTDPKDKNSMPPLETRLVYKECIKDPMTIKFNTYLSDTELQFRRTEPVAMVFNTARIGVGDSFPVENGGVPRFKVTKIIPKTTDKKEVAVLDDLLTKEDDKIEIEYTKSLEMPGRRAKVVCTLGTEEEKTVSDGEEFSFAVAPDIKFKVQKITDTELTLQFTPPGAKAKVTKTFAIPPPP